MVPKRSWGIASERRMEAYSRSSTHFPSFCHRSSFGSAGETKGHGGFIYDHLIFPLFTKNRYADKERQERLIQQSGLDWTIVRPAPFSEAKPHCDFQVLTEVGSIVLRKVSRTEVASFVVEELEQGANVRKTLFIGHSK